jgi:hypothetical protein
VRLPPHKFGVHISPTQLSWVTDSRATGSYLLLGCKIRVQFRNWSILARSGDSLQGVRIEGQKFIATMNVFSLATKDRL